MPRPASAIGSDGLPLWDTFEASFFLVAGLFIGVVLGFLFPSIWRSLRRRFRNVKRFSPHDPELVAQIESPVALLAEDDDIETNQHPQQGSYTVAQAFVMARSYIQEGKAREAIKYYLDILGFEQVTKKETNRALFELSQTYASLSLATRAFETAFELLHRKPENATVFEHTIDICHRFGLVERVRSVIQVFSGTPSNRVRMKVAHALCVLGERALEEGRFEESLQFARDAGHWEVLSARARLLLWQTTSAELWGRALENPKSQWSALAIDLEARWQIQKGTGVSPYAGAQHLARVLVRLCSNASPLATFESMKGEFSRLCGWEKMNETERAVQEWLVLTAALQLANESEVWNNSDFSGIVTVLAPRAWPAFVLPVRTIGTSLNAVRQGLAIHACRQCKSHVAQFDWTCNVCGALESLEPVLEYPGQSAKQ